MNHGSPLSNHHQPNFDGRVVCKRLSNMGAPGTINRVIESVVVLLEKESSAIDLSPIAHNIAVVFFPPSYRESTSISLSAKAPNFGLGRWVQLASLPERCILQAWLLPCSPRRRGTKPQQRRAGGCGRCVVSPWKCLPSWRGSVIAIVVAYQLVHD